jgi:hypothetical protein
MIKINTEASRYTLTGNIQNIIEKRREKSNFESIGALHDLLNNQIIIPFTNGECLTKAGNNETQYQAIIRLFDKFNIKYKKSEETEKLIEHIDRENESFKIFSKKADNIRNNIHGGGEFNAFTNIIEIHLKRELYTLQLLSAYHIAFSQNACNFSVPGAGKTSIVYGAYAYLKSLNQQDSKFVDRLLIIGPLSSFGPWKDEYIKCFGKTTSIKELVGINQYDRQNHFFSNKYTEITLISYQSAAVDIENIITFLKKNKVMVVLDEAHKIKNVEGGKWASAILSIAQFASSRVVLTGTPAPNGYQDLYNLYKFIWPYKDIIGFPVQYLKELSANNFSYSKQNIEQMIHNISPFYMRIKKSDLQLPEPKFHKPILVKMGNIQKRIYSFIENKYISYLEDENKNSSFNKKLKKAKLVRLMQCLTNPRLLLKPLDEYLQENGLSSNLDIDDREIMKLINNYNFETEVPAKFIEIEKLLVEILDRKGADGRVVIWAIFIGNMIDLKEYLRSRNIESELLYGAIPNENEELSDEILTREKIINKFHNDNCPYKVIIANPFAVGESISLHKACHNAIYLEKNFNATLYMQSKDRIHRYGLNKNDLINYYYFISDDSIEIKIHERVLEKERLMLEIIENEEIPLLSMNMDSSNENRNDIISIIENYHDRKNSKSNSNLQ